LHIVSLTSTLDVPRLVVVSGSDGQGLLVEVPDLGSSTIWNLDDHVSVVDQVKVSVIWELGDDVEISFNIESELLVKLSLSWLLLVFVDIDDLPSLVNLAILLFHDDVSVFIIKSSINGNNLSSFICDETIILVSEHLPPS